MTYMTVFIPANKSLTLNTCNARYNSLPMGYCNILKQQQFL